MKNIEYEIELINNIIKESVVHGGDSGGAYFSNTKKVYLVIQEWLNYHNLSDIYTIDEQELEGEPYPQIVYKKGNV